MAGLRAAIPAGACAAFDQPGLDGATIPAAQVHAAQLATPANEFAEVARVEDRFRRREAHRSWRPAPQFC
jgi:hypothetical protein